MTTVERVLEILRQGGYRELPKPLMIGTMPFDFAHTLIAEERALDLIVVVDLAQESDDRRLVQKIHALARALDVMGSKRPMTTILASAQPGPTILQAIGRVCRVLPVGAPSGPKAEETLRDWLAVLLPLAEVEPVSALADWKTELRKHLPNLRAERVLETAAITLCSTWICRRNVRSCDKTRRWVDIGRFGVAAAPTAGAGGVQGR